MASSINRNQEVVDGAVIVKITLISKDAGDSLLIQKFGDIVINPTGTFDDPADVTFPNFYVNAGEPVCFYHRQEIMAIFKDYKLSLPVLERQANLWGDAITLQIQNAMISLRALGTGTDTTTMNTAVNI